MARPDEIYFELGLGTRMRRLQEMLTADAERLYEELGINIRVSYFYVLYALSLKGAMPISELAKLAGFSHSAVSQTVKRLIKEGLVETRATEDARQKEVVFTPYGEEALAKLGPVWDAIDRVMKDAIKEGGTDLIAALEGMETAFERVCFYDRCRRYLDAEQKPKPAFEIIPYHVDYKQDFYDLNAWWVEKYFKMEPVDENVLSNPEDTILNKGGEIFFAVINGKAVGTVALKAEGDGVFELTKLGVDPTLQQGGMGRALCEAVIERFQARGGKTLYLETNTKLTPAIDLYWKLGFVELKPKVASVYERANYYMEWLPEEAAKAKRSKRGEAA